MTGLTLYLDKPEDNPAAPWAIWSGRDAPGGTSIEKLVEENLLRIRGEHMQWANNIAALTTAGGKTLEDALSGGAQPSMWWTSLLYERHPRLSPWLYTLYKLRSLELLLNEKNFGHLNLVGGDRILRNIIKSLCAEKSVSFNFIERPDSPRRSNAGWTRKIYAATPAPLRAIGRLAHWLATIKSKFPALLTLPQPEGIEPATIATYFPNIDLLAAKKGIFRSRYWESLHDALDSEQKQSGKHFCRWLFIRFPSPELSLSQCVKYCKDFEKSRQSGLSFNYLEEFLDFRAILKAIRRWAAIWLMSFRAQKDFAQACRLPGSQLDFWRLAAKEWAESFQGWRCLERCLQNEAFENYYRLAGPQRWSLFALENCPWERMLAAKARKIACNGPVYGAQHSTVRPTDFRYFDAPETFAASGLKNFQPDIIGGNGQSSCKQWLDNGMPSARLRELEALRYLYLAKRIKNAASMGIAADNGQNRILLVLTSFFEEETRSHLRLLKEALDAGLLEDWQIILKPHPYLSVQWWLDSLPGDQASKISISARRLEEELLPGRLAWTSNSTTAALEAAYLKLPLMVMLPDNDFDLCPIQDIPGLVRTGTLDDARAGLANPAPALLPQGYLNLDARLPAWRQLLGLNQK